MTARTDVVWTLVLCGAVLLAGGLSGARSPARSKTRPATQPQGGAEQIAKINQILSRLRPRDPKSEQAAEITCRRLNKFLTGLVVAPGSLDTVRTCQVKHAVGKPSQGQTGEAEGYQTVLIWSGGGPFQIWMRKGEDGYSVVFGPDDKQVMGSLSCGDAMKLCLKLNSHWAFSGKEKQ